MAIEQALELKTDAPGSPRIDAAASTQVNLPTENQRISASAALARFREELAYYQADAPFLTVEKQAARCAKLSALLTATLQHRLAPASLSKQAGLIYDTRRGHGST